MASILEKAKKTFASGNDNMNVTPAFLDEPMVEYQVSAATNNMHSIPRFGNTNNFPSLFLREDDDTEGETSEEYTRGLLFVGGFILAFFGLWCITVVVFKVWGEFCKSRYPGFLSGQPFTLNEEDEPTKDEYTQWKKRSKRIRVVFLISGLFLVIFSGLMIFNGFGQLEETRTTADKSLKDARYLVSDAAVVAQDLRDVGLSAIELRDQLIVELDNERLCPNDPSYLAQTDITKTVQDNAGLAIDMLEVLGEFATRDLKQMEDGLSVANNVINNLESLVKAVEEREWVGVGFVVPLVLLTLLMMFGALLSLYDQQNECYEFSLSWIFLPMFIFWIIASFVFCGLLAISATANADFCGGTDTTPDNTILQSLVNSGLNQSSTEFKIARYYLNQCTREAEVDPFLFLRRHQAETTTAHSVVNELSASLQKIDVVDLSMNCGRDFEPLSSSLDTMMAILDRLDEAGTAGLNLLSCERLVPIYTDAVYEGTCTTSVTGLTWIFSSLLIISVTGMLMITLRSSYLSEVVLTGVDDASIARAMKRGQNVAKASASESETHVGVNHWREQAVRQDTSDTGSIYTEGGELNINVYDVENPSSFDRESPKLYELEENSYDSRGNIRASAPYEHEMLDYVYDSYNTNTDYKSRVY